MDAATFKERVKRLQEANSVIEKLDPVIRERAFQLLEAYVAGTSQKVPPASPAHASKSDGSTTGTPLVGPNQGEDLGDLLEAHDHEKPADAAILLTAHHFRRYGSAPFSLDELRELAAEHGLTIPDRVNMTLKQKKYNKKEVFRGLGGGRYKPTIAGESYFRNVYNLRKGTEKKPSPKPD